MSKVPFFYVGNKIRLVKKLLIKLVPAHRTYVEVFGGAGSFLLAKSPVKVDVFNDLDSLIVNFFRVIRDKGKFEKFKELVKWTPYAREEFEDFRQNLEQGDEIDKAHKFFCVANMSFFNFGEGFRISKKENKRKDLLGYLSSLEEIRERLENVVIENLDYKEIFERYDSLETFFYCDPPYVTGDGKEVVDYYRVNMSFEEHKEFIQRVKKLKGKVLISNVPNSYYDKELESWKTGELMFKRSVGRDSVKPLFTDKVWRNYNLSGLLGVC